MRIRPAHRADASAVNELLDQLGYPQDGRAATANRIQTWAEDPSSAAYVAEVGDDLLGVIAVHVCPFFERDGSWGRIAALVVSGRARGRGVGSQLVAAAESSPPPADASAWRSPVGIVGRMRMSSTGAADTSTKRGSRPGSCGTCQQADPDHVVERPLLPRRTTRARRRPRRGAPRGRP
ncbi:GNAT family N-acetyltransferase [Streptomyces violarus]|uniref:GNAT family N-acetyltransferase n=1 Tax=Streptomyces violarus TaxID=67380 RepID=UPI0037047B95